MAGCGKRYPLSFGMFDPTKKRFRLRDFRSKQNQYLCISTAEELYETFCSWDARYTCQDATDVSSFISNYSTGMIGVEVSCAMTLANSGLIDAVEMKEATMTEECYTKDQTVMAAKYICGVGAEMEGVEGNCNYVSPGKTELVTHAKDLSATASFCLDPVCLKKISDRYMWAYKQMVSVRDAFINRYNQDIEDFVTANGAPVTGLVPLDEYNIHKFLGTLESKLSELCNGVTDWIIVAPPCIMQAFKTANVYDGDSRHLKTMHGVKNGFVGTAYGMFDLIEVPGLPNNCMYVGARGAIKFLHDPEVMYGCQGEACNMKETHTYVHEYGLAKSCSPVCDLFKLTFEGENACKYEMELTCDAKEGAVKKATAKKTTA